MSDNKLWGGRFSGSSDSRFARFNQSLSFDRRLFEVDVQGSIAHCNGLVAAGVLTAAEAETIKRGLQLVLQAAQENKSYLSELAVEDIHSFVEARLVQLVGDVGRKLHAGRSRNDQVATDLRLWLRATVDDVIKRIREAQSALLDFAEANPGVVLPGYTHLQRAQPVLLAHWCLAHFEMLARDRERLIELRKRINILPLGSAALAGTSYPIDREAVARELGFEGISGNSLDAVSDRDFCVEFVSACSLIMVHLSRLAEDIILYSSSEFGFFELSDAVATGSSLMPQKKNPDSMELVRGKSGRVFGHLMSLLTMLKGLPLAYNKDMQEDKEAVFDTGETVNDCLEVTATVLKNISVDETKAWSAATHGYLNATELADYLVRRGLPFREAHELVGQIVLKAIDQHVELHELSLADLQSFSDLIEDDVFAALSLEQTLASKSAPGGTAPARVGEALSRARTRI